MTFRLASGNGHGGRLIVAAARLGAARAGQWAGAVPAARAPPQGRSAAAVPVAQSSVWAARSDQPASADVAAALGMDPEAPQAREAAREAARARRARIVRPF